MTTNIGIAEFYEKWTCLNEKEDIWTCGTCETNEEKCKVIYESDDYMVVTFL